jgi:hypothetical protein
VPYLGPDAMPVLPDLSEGISRVGDAITAVIDRKRKEREFAAQQTLAREVEDRKWQQNQNQYDIQNAQNTRLEARDAETFEMERSKYREGARKRFLEAQARGDTQEMEAIANSTYVGRGPDGKPQYGSAKPVPGAMRDVGPEPKVPEPPQALPAPAPRAVPPEIAALQRAKAKRQEAELGLTSALPELTPDEKRNIEMLNMPARQAAGVRYGKEHFDEPFNPDALEAARSAAQLTTPEAAQRAKAARLESEAEAQQRSQDLLNFPAAQARDAEAVRDVAGSNASNASDFEKEKAGFPGEHGKWLADKRLAEMETPYEVNLGGTPFRSDTQSARYQARTNDANDFRRSVQPQSASDQQLAALIHGEILAGFPLKDAIVAYNKETRGIRSDELMRWKTSETNASKERIAETMSKRPMVMAGQREERQTEQMGNMAFNQFLTQQGYKTDAAAMRSLVQTADSLRHNNSALDVTAGAAFAKSANGAGVLTDKDFERFWTNVGGAKTKYSPTELWDRAVEGLMGEEKRKMVLQATAAKVEQEKQRFTFLAQQADKKFANEPWYPGSRAAYFDIGQGLPPIGESATPNRRMGGRRVPPDMRAPKSKSIKDMSNEELERLAK